MSGKDENLVNGLNGEGSSDHDTESELPGEVLKRFESLHAAPPRDPHRASQGRREYLSLARSISPAVPAASGKPVGLLNRWFGPFLIPFQNKAALRTKRTLHTKEGMSMVLKFASVAMLVLVLILGSASATVYAAQDSLPSEPLYGLKIAGEDLALKLAQDEPAKFQLAMKYINRRGDEIFDLKVQGQPLGEPVMTRLQEQMTFALQQVAGMPDHEMMGALEQYRASLMHQQQKMFQAGQVDGVDPALEAAKAMIQAHHRIADGGLQDPALFRQQVQSGNLYGQPDMPGPYGPPDEIPPGSDQTAPGQGGRPENPGPEQPGPAEKPPGGSDQQPVSPAAGTPQAPDNAKGPGGPGGPSSNPGQGGPGSGGKGGEKGVGTWPTPTPTPTPMPVP